MADLNQLLNDWASRRAPTSERIESLQAQIRERLLTEVADASLLEPTVRLERTAAHDSAKSGSSIALVMVVASLLLAVTMFWPRPRSESFRSTNIAAGSVPSNDLSARQPLFRELDRMFDSHWLWLGEVNGRVHLQTDEPAQSTMRQRENNSGVAVRLTLVQRRPGEMKWRVVWDASVLTRTEEWVQLPDEATGARAVSLWAYALPDGSVLVESDVSLTSPVLVRHSDQRVFGASQRPARLWSVRRPDGEFQMIQSIARMEAQHG